MTYQITSLKSLVKTEDKLSVNERIARVIVKKAAADSKIKESVGVVVPRIALNQLNALMADAVGKQWLLEAVESMQDKVVRRYAEAGKLALFEDQIGIGALLDAMKQSNDSVRFSKESIASWFANDMMQLLKDAIVAKVGNIAEDRLDKMIVSYLEDFQLLAAREVILSDAIKTKLTKALALLPDDYEPTAVSEKVAEKLNAASQRIVEDVL